MARHHSPGHPDRRDADRRCSSAIQERRARRRCRRVDLVRRPPRSYEAPALTTGYCLMAHSGRDRAMVASGIVRPTPPRVEIHALLDWELDREGARSPRLALCLLEKAMAAARNWQRSRAK